MSEVDAFIIGVPKAGTTWLANVLSQNPAVILSDPKEPNIVASHQGTFGRDQRDPDWSRYDDCFSGDGLRVDASIHTFACPLAPSRLSSRVPDVPMILCLREPVSRAFSHWKMIIDTEEDARNGADWSDFAVAWEDDRLSGDSHYGRAMQGWLEHFPLNQFLIIDSQRMRNDPEGVLGEVGGFLGLPNFEYDFDPSRHANSATDRRPITNVGRAIRSLFSLIPAFIKKPIVSRLQARDINIYAAPVISRRAEKAAAGPEHYSICADSLRSDLKDFESLTGFDTSRWTEAIDSNRRISS
ncbi:MAG: sulfotransferase domain-containing protein [Candidatus Thermoplasmatota archaeon]|nr:sulfotransferase domain-containing protein [Candidatus Thermoplasmatota archaeon]